MITVLLASAAWAISATAVLVVLARGRRRRDTQAQHADRALKARQAATRTPSSSRTNQHRRHR